jgi:hypothetical protein
MKRQPGLHCVHRDSIAIKRSGNELRNRTQRGPLEPNLVRFGRRFYMTIRAEDDRGHVTVSDDGLTWAPPRAWCRNDGEPLTMSTTQQHWLPHRDGLYLVYTRKAEKNVNVMRRRAPLDMAAVDPGSLRLVRTTERVVLPLIGDGVNDAKHVARMGNLHTTAASPDESWVTVGECLPHDGWCGDLLMARIHWSRPNRLAWAHRHAQKKTRPRQRVASPPKTRGCSTLNRWPIRLAGGTLRTIPSCASWSGACRPGWSRVTGGPAVPGRCAGRRRC